MLICTRAVSIDAKISHSIAGAPSMALRGENEALSRRDLGVRKRRGFSRTLVMAPLIYFIQLRSLAVFVTAAVVVAVFRERGTRAVLIKVFQIRLIQSSFCQ